MCKVWRMENNNNYNIKKIQSFMYDHLSLPLSEIEEQKRRFTTAQCLKTINNSLKY